jgi:hypothetical protein
MKGIESFFLFCYDKSNRFQKFMTDIRKIGPEQLP